ncbi:MAG: hypothetical protein J6W06_03815, partial [Bacteroidales bacterium]|nr:hypothetical protein [Bacteroidales bacterium]
MNNIVATQPCAATYYFYKALKRDKVYRLLSAKLALSQFLYALATKICANAPKIHILFYKYVTSPR